jgi:hypothetical protein
MQNEVDCDVNLANREILASAQAVLYRSFLKCNKQHNSTALSEEQRQAREEERGM